MSLSGLNCHAESEYKFVILGQNTILNFKNAVRDGSWNAVDISVQYAANFLNQCPTHDPFRPLVVNNYIHGLKEKYRWTKVPSHLNEAITLARELVKSTSDEDYRKIAMMSTLLLLLEEKSTTTDENEKLKLLQEGIDLGRKVVEGTQDNHVDKASRLNSLGRLFRKMSLVTSSKDHVSEAATCFHSALHYSSSRTVDRLQACLQLSSVSSDWDQLYGGFESAISLIPSLVTFSQEVKDKQHVLSQVGTLASNGAAAALQVGKGPLVALSMLERGRGVLGASLEEMRIDVEELRAKHPELASEFESLREYLDAPTKENEAKRYGSDDVPYFSEMWPNQRHEKAKSFSRLIGQIQNLPGFESFWATMPDADALQKVASEGPIVVINVSRYRCDALVVERHQIKVVPLPLLTEGEVKRRAKSGDLGTLETLEWLWETVAEAVLDAIGLTQQPPEEEKWPHLWWVPTGPLVGFPIHAAGRHANQIKGECDTVMDRVVSSYSYTVKAILRGRSKPIRPPPSGAKVQALLVGMEHTSGCSHLPFATHEVKKVGALCQSMDLDVAQPPPKKQDVLFHLRKSAIFHFAGHGSTSRKDPLKSHIRLQGGKQGRLRVSDLFSINIHQQAPFLAYLSACGTGRIGDDKYWDESIHLMAAFQIAGFRHVIGTLWEVRDETCVEMAKLVYGEMGDAGITDYAVSRGLHRAARQLRDRGRVNLRSSLKQYNDRSDRDIASDDEGDGNGQDRLLPWVPYVHCGV